MNVAGGPLATDPFTMEVVNTQIGSPPISPMEAVESTLMASQPTATVSAATSVQGSGPDYIITSGSVVFALDRTSGSVVTLTATAGAGGAVLEPGLQLRAQSVTVVRTHEFSYPEDLTAIEDNNGQIARPDIRAEISLSYGETYPMDGVLHYANPLPAVSIRAVRSIDNPDIDALLQREISDMLTVQNAHLGLDDLVHVETMDFTIVGGTLLVAEFGCQIAFEPPPMFHA